MRKSLGLALLATTLLSGCQALEVANGVEQDEPTALPHATIPEHKIKSEQRRLAALGVEALDEGRLKEASDLFNRATKLDIKNSTLQFLNGLAYHLRALKEDTTLFPLAEQGYEISLQFDPTNNFARQYLGLLHLDQRNYVEALQHLSESLVYDDRDPDILYNLAVASYYAGDPEVAAGALNLMRDRQPDDPKALRASSIVMAALNEPAEAESFFSRYQAEAQEKAEVSELAMRLGQWRRFHDLSGVDRTQNIDQAQFNTFGARDLEVRPLADAVEDEDAEEEDVEDLVEPDGNNMVIVDVVIIRTEEDISTSKGVNLLNGLTIQFGNVDPSTGNASAAYSIGKVSYSSTDNPGLTRTITRGLNIPAITYSLNIANSNTDRNEILARPTLVALEGEPSVFFSGVEINAAAIGGAASDGSTVEVNKEIGVKLSVTPKFLDDGRVKLSVEAERTFLTTPNTSSVTFTLRIDTSKTNVNANVAMNFGETLILSGLSEKETERTRDGVPGLQDVPLVQYLFSKQTSRDFQKSVLILLTPRRPQYVYQSEKAKEKVRKRLSKEERVLYDLQARFSDAFRPYPNWASVFHHMQANSLYREFRTGDVTLETWADHSSHQQRLKKALEFLYY